MEVEKITPSCKCRSLTFHTVTYLNEHVLKEAWTGFTSDKRRHHIKRRALIYSLTSVRCVRERVSSFPSSISDLLKQWRGRRYKRDARNRTVNCFVWLCGHGDEMYCCLCGVRTGFRRSERSPRSATWWRSGYVSVLMNRKLLCMTVSGTWVTVRTEPSLFILMHHRIILNPLYYSVTRSN